MRESGESVGFVQRSGTKLTVSPLGAKRPTLPALGRFEDLEQSGKAFNSGEDKADSIKLIGRADTLPTEGFYD